MVAESPIKDSKHDRLGFAAAAEQLARTFAENDLSEGFVIGVEGSWGSGKSSLVSMAFMELSKSKEGPIPIEFAPWLVGDRDELLWSLFTEIETAAIGQAKNKQDKDAIRGAFKRFEAISSGGAKIAGLTVSVAILSPGLTGRNRTTDTRIFNPRARRVFV